MNKHEENWLEDIPLTVPECVRLTELADSCGCAAKLEPRLLAGVLEGICRGEDENLLVGAETSDDGAIYRINDQVAMIQTLDFFPPMVDDPWDFGRVAAANALSDIYAMGGEPKVALNIAAFPSGLDTGILKKILEGGASKVLEAGAVMAGGHTIRDKTPKYGLSVSGFVHPDRIWKNCSARPGDALVLTKPLGVGVINTAVKARLASSEAADEVLRVMTTLNRFARDVGTEFSVHACTDVTGFGLLGHALEMAIGSRVSIRLAASQIPVLPWAREYASMGLVPVGAYRNREFVGTKIRLHQVEEWLQDVLFDPQTSGGLLFSVAGEEAEEFCRRLSEGEFPAVRIGQVEEKQDVSLLVE
ncbi:MAG TPA: selenide, water dikinase SelD [Candidatus Pullilachnospira intestinigallinarum]|nr:selenide, water dikinase SelD [Candidatus Pullilachnospira intestinigallinarum]